MFSKRIHVFRAGNQTSAQGVQRNFSEKDLQQVVDSYDPAIHTAPLVLGHAGDNDSTPAYGWIKGFAKKGDDLYADVEFSPVAKNLITEGHYRKVSISFYAPDSAINPSKGKWSARHLALLGASPPAVKGLEPFSFSEQEGIYDFAVNLAASEIFDDELGPTIIVERSPLEMLREKLDAVRQDVSSAVKELQTSQQTQTTETVQEAAASSAATNTETAQMANPDATQFKETSKNLGREGTEIAQQTADLSNHFPEEEFMDQGQISRKHVKGANGQVMQVVENVYDEAHKEPMAKATKKTVKSKGEELSDDHKELPPALKARSAQVKAQGHFAEDHDEDMTDTGVMKRKGGDGGPGADHAEGDEFGRYETARSASDGYVDRMKTGKQGAAGNEGRMKTAKSGAQDADRMKTAESAEQEDDRFNTAKASKDNAEGESRWAGQEDGYDQAMNSDQYDAGAKDYGVNAPKTSSGNDPYGRDETATKIPTECEEMPCDEIFAVSTVNVMSDGSMRVLRTKSSDTKAKSVKTHDYLYGEPEAAEMTGEDGVTIARKSMKGKKMVEHAEYDQGDMSGEESLESLRENIGDGKKSKNRQLIPGAMDDTDTPGETVGPDGAYAESYRGEKKSTSKQLTPGAMDEVDEADQTVGPDGAYGESLDSLRANIGDGKKSKARQLTPGAMDDTDTPDEVSKKSGGAYAEEHGERKMKDPYTKTGFGSTYEEGEGDDGVDEGDEDYNELSTDHACGGGGMNYGMNPEMDYGMGSGGQAKAMGFPQQMYDELMSLKSKYAELERTHQEEKMNFRKMQMAEAIGHLYTEGRLTDGVMPEQELVSYVEGLEFGTLEFSEGETSATKLISLLSKLPPMVSFGEVAGGTFQYAESDLDPHERALQMVEKGEASDYVEALKKAMFS